MSHQACDGNECAVHAAYGMSEFCFIYPITPSSTMAERADAYAGSGLKNALGVVPVVYQMQSEGGAAASLHGCVSAGGLGSSFTSSQGLLLMIPSLYKIAGERAPAVLHVAARQTAFSATSIYCDHTDVMSVRMTGWAMAASATAQECMDVGAACHLAAIEKSAAFMHFFDGFQTSHSVSTCEKIPFETLKQLIPMDKVQEHRALAMDPAHPHQKGNVASRGEWMQLYEASNPLYNSLPDAFEAALLKVSQATGRKYAGCFEYSGAPDAERVVVALTTGALACEDAVEDLCAQGEKVGVVRVRLFRPWSTAKFLACLPKTVKRVAVLDRTKEPGSNGEPLFLDVLTTITEAADRSGVVVIGGRYGLGDKPFTPRMVRAVLAELAKPEPKRRFTVGIIDDVTHLSLTLPEPVPVIKPWLTQSVMWGLGADGTVGAAQMAIKIISESGVQADGQFHFTAHKSGGVTVSHLRFSRDPSHPIKAAYPVDEGEADYVACHHPSYIGKYPILEAARPGAVLLINGNPDTIAKELPASWKRMIAAKNLNVNVVDAMKIAEAAGLGQHYNLVLLTAFFQLSGAMPMDQALTALKAITKKQYAKKGEAVIQKNIAAIDMSVAGTKKLAIPADWKDATDETTALVASKKKPLTDYERDLKEPLTHFVGDSVPVSVVGKYQPGGRAPNATTRVEKRGVSAVVPRWIDSKCIQCNFCSFSCPHACIRPFLLDEAEAKAAPETLKTIDANGVGKGLKFRIQVSSNDCVGCGVCAKVCPVKALEMTPFHDMVQIETVNWDYCFDEVKPKPDVYPIDNVKGSMFKQPLFEFCGACAGCGEAPYIRLLTQLYGDRGIFACASGCNAAYSFALASNPYSINAEGRGPATSHSLFEDTAEYGFGIARTRRGRRENFAKQIEALLALPDKGAATTELTELLAKWMTVYNDAAASEGLRRQIEPLLKAARATASPAVAAICDSYELLSKASVWCIGGDGWACDIDYGGLDHVLHSGEELKVLVLDTEVYSNTGGQKSKSTSMGSVHKFESAGKSTSKKDLPALFMELGNIYVATVCLFANPAQCLKAFAEAEAYKGPSVIIAYSPCIEHGIEGDWVSQAKRAVDSGYWPLLRYNPATPEGKNPLSFDAPLVPKITVADFIAKENRFQRLTREHPERAQFLHEGLAAHVAARLKKFQDLAGVGKK